MTTKKLFLSSLAIIFPFYLNAHVSFVGDTNISIKKNFKATLAVPHGCEGTDTLAVTIDIPEGVIDVKPQPKANWAIKKTKINYNNKNYTLYGNKVTQGISTLTWYGNLPDDEYDEFSFIAYLAERPTNSEKLYFKVKQQCKNGELLWVDTSGKKIKGHEVKELGAPFMSIVNKK